MRRNINQSFFVFLFSVVALSVIFAGNNPKIEISDCGGNDVFSFARENEESNVFMVSPTGNSISRPTAVSHSFLELVINGPVDDETKLELLNQFPQIMNGMYQEEMEANYPDSSLQFETPFQSYQGDAFTIIQDPLAAPYVQISITLPSGKVETFSLNRDMVENIIDDKSIEDGMLLLALQNYPYRLPENARIDFDNLTASNIFAIAEQDVEDVKNQEFVKSVRWERERREREQSAKYGHSVPRNHELSQNNLSTPKIQEPLKKVTPKSQAEIEPPATKSSLWQTLDKIAADKRLSAGYVAMIFAMLICITCIILLRRKT